MSSRTIAGETCYAGKAENLPFVARRFQYAVSVTALCFAEDQVRALREMLRVTLKHA